MFPIVHFVFTIVPSILVIMTYGWIGIFFWIGSFFVDFDHYIWYVIRKRDFSLKNAYTYGKIITEEESYLHIFHIVEFLILISIWALYSKLIFMVVLGLAFHMVIDFVDMINKKVFFARNLFFFMWIKDYSPSNSTKLKT